VLGLVETKEFDLFIRSKMAEYENVMAKCGVDDAMLASPSATESNGGLRKYMFSSGEDVCSVLEKLAVQPGLILSQVMVVPGAHDGVCSTHRGSQAWHFDSASM
jgi:hypothetical protein